jgi:hypothetical protein
VEVVLRAWLASARLPSERDAGRRCRYNDATSRARIWDGVGLNWLSGHISAVNNVCYHEGWTYYDGVDYDKNDWVCSSSRLWLLECCRVVSSPVAIAAAQQHALAPHADSTRSAPHARPTQGGWGSCASRLQGVVGYGPWLL